MKRIHAKITSLSSAMDTTFSQYIAERIPSKILTLNELSERIPSLFVESDEISVSLAKPNTKQPPRKRRKLNAINNASNSNSNANTKNSTADHDDLSDASCASA